MKIVFLIRSLDVGGAETQLVFLAKGLRAAGHAVVVAEFYAGGRLEQPLREAAVPLRALGKRGRWDVIGFLARLIAMVKAERPDVVHSYLVGPNVLMAILKPLFPRVKLVWGVRASNMELRRYDWLARITFSASCRLARFADLIIANSNAGKDYHVAQGYPAKRVAVIVNGIDVARFRPDIGARERVRREWGVATGQKLIGLVGRFDPMKDHPNFLRAAVAVARARANTRFVCVGDGDENYRRELRALALELGLADRMQWHGARDDMPAVYNALDILVSASSFGEGFSNAVAEAMACCIPCVVTDVGDSARIVAGTGAIVPPNDAEALANGCLVMLDRLAQAPGIAARERVASLFDADALVRNTIAALARLCPAS